MYIQQSDGMSAKTQIKSAYNRCFLFSFAKHTPTKSCYSLFSSSVLGRERESENDEYLLFFFSSKKAVDRIYRQHKLNWLLLHVSFFSLLFFTSLPIFGVKHANKFAHYEHEIGVRDFVTRWICNGFSITFEIINLKLINEMVDEYDLCKTIKFLSIKKQKQIFHSISIFFESQTDVPLRKP